MKPVALGTRHVPKPLCACPKRQVAHIISRSVALRWVVFRDTTRNIVPPPPSPPFEWLTPSGYQDHHPVYVHVIAVDRRHGVPFSINHVEADGVAGRNGTPKYFWIGSPLLHADVGSPLLRVTLREQLVHVLGERQLLRIRDYPLTVGESDSQGLDDCVELVRRLEATNAVGQRMRLRDGKLTACLQSRQDIQRNQSDQAVAVGWMLVR